MLQDEEHHDKSAVHQLLSRSARGLGFRWYDMYYLERGLQHPVPDVGDLGELEIAPATEEDGRRILAERGVRHRPRLALHLASERTRCYVARSPQGLAGYSFLKTGLMDITGLDTLEIPIREMPRGTGLTHDSYVWPAFRRQKIFHALLAHIYRDRRAAGFDRVCNLIDPANVSSLKVHLDMGARIQRVRFLKLPGSGAMVVGRNFEIGQLDPIDDAGVGGG